MKGYITSIMEEESSFVLEVIVGKPSLPGETRWDLMDKGERREYLDSDEHKQALEKIDKEESSIKSSLTLGEVDFTICRS